MGDMSDNLDNTFLVGPIDTEKEIKLILSLLEKQFFLRRKVTENEINTFLNSLKQMRLDGPVDTLREVEIFLDMMRKSNMLVGPIDTPEEVKLFTNNLQMQGYMPQSFVSTRNITRKIPEIPIRKRKKFVEIDEEGDEDENNIPPPKVQ
jgi:hypothetical protein